jgi:hypothetical protein
MTGEPWNMYESLMGEELGAPPVPRTPEETVSEAFRALDRADRDDRRRAEQLAKERQAGRQDAIDVARFMGRGRTHADVISDYAALSDRADAWQQHQSERAAKRAAVEREQRQQARVAELEAELATTSARAERMGRNFSQAVDGWVAERHRSEGASFRDEQDPVVGYRAVRGGEIEVHASQVNRTRQGGPILGVY